MAAPTLEVASSDEKSCPGPLSLMLSPKRSVIRKRSPSPAFRRDSSVGSMASPAGSPNRVIPKRLTLNLNLEVEDEVDALPMSDSTAPVKSGNSTMMSTLSSNCDFEFVNSIRMVSEVRNPWDFAQIGPLLGKGNSGSVIKALNLEDYKIYALKRVYVTSHANRSQMLKEVNAFSVLKSEHLVSSYGAIVEDDEPEEITLVLEYMNRGSLQNVIDSHGPVTDEIALGRIAKMVLLGMNDMHKVNLIHRDIKPGNIVLNHKGDVKLTDFGIAREVAANAAAQPVATFIGTQVYMSPERIEHKPYSFASDIWSFGLSMLTLATGSLPYSGVGSGGFATLFYALTQLPAPCLPEKGFSPEFSDFIAKCLIKEADLRWSAEDLLAHPFLKDLDTSASSFQGWPWDVMDEKRLTADQNDIQEIADVLKEINITGDTLSPQIDSAKTASTNNNLLTPPSTSIRRKRMGKVLENEQYESIADTLGVQNVRFVQSIIDTEFGLPARI